MNHKRFCRPAPEQADQQKDQHQHQHNSCAEKNGLFFHSLILLKGAGTYVPAYSFLRSLPQILRSGVIGIQSGHRIDQFIT